MHEAGWVAIGTAAGIIVGWIVKWSLGKKKIDVDFTLKADSQEHIQELEKTEADLKAAAMFKSWLAEERNERVAAIGRERAARLEDVSLMQDRLSESERKHQNCEKELALVRREQSTTRKIAVGSAVAVQKLQQKIGNPSGPDSPVG